MFFPAVDEKGFEFSHVLTDARREIKIVMPVTPEIADTLRAMGMKDEQLTGVQAQERAVKFLFATVAGVCRTVGVSQLDAVLHELCADIVEEIRSQPGYGGSS